jgi:hypothetical protein
VLNEWFAWSWLKALAAYDVLKLAHAMGSGDNDYGDPKLAAVAGPCRHGERKNFSAGGLELEDEDDDDDDDEEEESGSFVFQRPSHGTSEKVALSANDPTAPLLRRSGGGHPIRAGLGSDASNGGLLLPGEAKGTAKGAAKGAASGLGAPTAAASGAWNAGASLRRWLLLPPLGYYVAVGCLLARTVAVGGRGHASMLNDTVWCMSLFMLLRFRFINWA